MYIRRQSKIFSFSVKKTYYCRQIDRKNWASHLLSAPNDIPMI